MSSYLKSIKQGSSKEFLVKQTAVAKALSGSDHQRIPSNTNLDTLTEIGTRFSDSVNLTRSLTYGQEDEILSDLIGSVTFSLDIGNILGRDDKLYQEITIYSTGTRWYRSQYSGSDWSSWKRSAPYTSEFFAPESNLDDLDSVNSKLLITPVSGEGFPSYRTLTSDDIPGLDASKIKTGILKRSVGGLGVNGAEVTAHHVYIGPTTSGSYGNATFRNLIASDINFVLNSSSIPNLDSSKITSGKFDIDRIPDLDSSKITSGILNYDRLPNFISYMERSFVSSDEYPSINDQRTSFILNYKYTGTDEYYRYTAGNLWSNWLQPKIKKEFVDSYRSLSPGNASEQIPVEGFGNDLNNYYSPGNYFYRASSGTSANNLQNYPNSNSTSKAFKLYVGQVTKNLNSAGNPTSSYPYQELWEEETGAVYYRYSTSNSGSNWVSWKILTYPTDSSSAKCQVLATPVNGNGVAKFRSLSISDLYYPQYGVDNNLAFSYVLYPNTDLLDLNTETNPNVSPWKNKGGGEWQISSKYGILPPKISIIVGSTGNVYGIPLYVYDGTRPAFDYYFIEYNIVSVVTDTAEDHDAEGTKPSFDSGTNPISGVFMVNSSGSGGFERFKIQSSEGLSIYIFSCQFASATTTYFGDPSNHQLFYLRVSQSSSSFVSGDVQNKINPNKEIYIKKITGFKNWK